MKQIRYTRTVKKDVSATTLIWTAVCSVAALLTLVGLLVGLLSLRPTAEEQAYEKRRLEVIALNKQLRAERVEISQKLRQEVLDGKWDQLLQEKIGPHSELVMDEIVSGGGLNGALLDGTVMIDGIKNEFTIGFKREKGGEFYEDQFRIAPWKEYQESRPIPRGDIHGAWVAMMYFVEGKLKNPSGAKFIGNAVHAVTHLGNGKYRIEASVDATNGFGATVRTPFSGVVESGNQWTLHSLEITQ